MQNDVKLNSAIKTIKSIPTKKVQWDQEHSDSGVNFQCYAPRIHSVSIMILPGIKMK